MDSFQGAAKAYTFAISTLKSLLKYLGMYSLGKVEASCVCIPTENGHLRYAPGSRHEISSRPVQVQALDTFVFYAEGLRRVGGENPLSYQWQTLIHHKRDADHIEYHVQVTRCDEGRVCVGAPNRRIMASSFRRLEDREVLRILSLQLKILRVS